MEKTTYSLAPFLLAFLFIFNCNATTKPKVYQLKSPDKQIVLRIQAGADLSWTLIDATDYKREIKTVSNKDKIEMHLAPGGGWAARFEKL